LKINILYKNEVHMANQSTLYLALSAICFTIVWAIYEQILSRISFQGAEDISPWVGFLSALGLFTLLFQIMIQTSHAAVQKWLSVESSLVGSWFQVFRIHNYTKSSNPNDAIRHGLVTINLSDTGLEITGENRKLGSKSAPSAWHSNKVNIQGSEVWLLFSSTGPGRGSTHGNMLFHLHPGTLLKRKPNRLVGYFNDSSPATHFGSIELFRDEAEYRKKIEELGSLSSSSNGDVKS
jgi:hypothetical protein